ncbi:hypothetical protein LUTEI9C_30281 [Luteimonas sp. 9C]|nr:hypothetical protein LUTEI9C_30281 [Luteimonas sp. 9C]
MRYWQVTSLERRRRSVKAPAARTNAPMRQNILKIDFEVLRAPAIFPGDDPRTVPIFERRVRRSPSRDRFAQVRAYPRGHHIIDRLGPPTD